MGPGSRIGIGVGLACALAACGRTEPYWWSDIYANDTGDEVDTDDGDSESSDDESSDSDTDSSSTDTDTDATDTDATATASTDTTSTDTDTSTTESCQPSAIDLVSDPPTVVFLLEQAGHMDNDFVPGVSRWEAAGAALFDPGQGLASAWEAEMRLGLTSFTSFNGNQGGACPVLTESAPALANAADMQATWLGVQPEDENPVGDAVTAVSAGLAMDPSPGTKTIVLLTARNPDTCSQPNPQNGALEAATAVDAAFQLGIGTRVLALGNVADAYAQALANVGVGLPAQGVETAPWSEPEDVDELIADLELVLTSLRPCSFALAPTLVAEGEQACTLELDGQLLPLDDPEGWSVDAGTTLMLQGSACAAFQQLGTPPELVCECDALP